MATRASGFLYAVCVILLWLGSPPALFETPFALAIEQAVALEWHRARPGATQFTALVRSYGLEQCRRAAEATQVASAPSGAPGS